MCEDIKKKAIVRLYCLFICRELLGGGVSVKTLTEQTEQD